MSLQSRVILFLIRLVGSLPLVLRSALGAVLGAVFSVVPTRDRRFAALQMTRFLGTKPGALDLMKLYAGIGQSTMEAFNLKPLLRGGRIRCDDDPEIERVLAEKRGIVALTGHLGNWDLLGAYMVDRGIPVTTIGREARNPHFQAVLASLRDAYGIKTLWRSDRSGVKAIISELRGARVVAALIDQDTAVTSILTPFFGHPVRTPSTLIEIGKQTDSLFTTAFMVRTGLGRYRVHVAEIDRSLTTAEILTVYHQRLEALIRAHPEQWVWFHKRWRAREDGTRMSSREYLTFLQEGAQ